MDGRNKYRPTKTSLTVAEYKSLVEAYKRENRKLKAELEKAQKDRAWAMEKLQDAQTENRRLGILLTRLSEKGDGNVEMDSR